MIVISVCAVTTAIVVPIVLTRRATTTDMLFLKEQNYMIMLSFNGGIMPSQYLFDIKKYLDAKRCQKDAETLESAEIGAQILKSIQRIKTRANQKLL